MKTTANIPFSEANTIAKKQFQGKEFDMEKSKIKVEDIKIYPENDLVVIEILLRKSKKELLLLKEIWFMINKTQNWFYQNKFQIKTKNILQN